MSRVMRSRYFPKSDVFKAVSRPWDSWLWKSWKEVAQQINEGSRWQVDNGVSIKVWQDDWFFEGYLKRSITVKPEGCTSLSVKELINQKGEGWNKELVRNLFSLTKASTTLSILVNSLGRMDRLICTILYEFKLQSGKGGM